MLKRTRINVMSAGLLIALFLLSSCMDDEIWLNRNKPDMTVESLSENHPVIIINEGNFMYGNASLTYYDAWNKKTENDIFYRQNGIPLGDVAYSGIVRDGLLYIVVNNSGKIVTLNFGKYPALKIFDFTTKVEGLNSPRFMHFVSERKVYLSDLYKPAITVFDPVTGEVIDSINIRNDNPDFIQHSAEQFIAHGRFIYTNCWRFDDQILVIDTELDALVDSIQVLKQPVSMVKDKDDKLWVLCDGGNEDISYGDEQAGLVKIDMNSRTVERIFPLEEKGSLAGPMLSPGLDTLYFINSDVYRMPVNAKTLPRKAFIPAEEEASRKLFYNLGIDPRSGEIYISDAIDYVQSGVVYRYSNKGEMLDTIGAGIIPGKFIFPAK